MATMSRPELHDPEHYMRYIPKEGGALDRLEMEAMEKDVPIIGPVLGRLLYMLSRAMGVRNVLELGTATGYSAIWLARAARQAGGRVVTVEWDPDMAAKARTNISEAGHGQDVEVMEGDARKIMDRFPDGHFDLVFNDVEKEHYSGLLDPSIRVLRTGGLMVFDNTSFKTAGDLLDRAFSHPMLETVNLYGLFPRHSPDYDSITLCIKK